MTSEPKRNLPASVRQRLLNLSKERKEPFDLVLVHYAIERLLYRLSRSRHAERFLLKGAMLFAVWSKGTHRPTRDVDFLGFGWLLFVAPHSFCRLGVRLPSPPVSW